MSAPICIASPSGLAFSPASLALLALVFILIILASVIPRASSHFKEGSA
jgi:hypothetical protein